MPDGQAVETMKGSGSRQRAGGAGGSRVSATRIAPRKRRTLAPASRRASKANNVIALADFRTDGEHLAVRADLPKGHKASILLFTGVQIVRDGAEG